MDENNVKTVSTAALAYLGDCVVELCVREYLVSIGLSSSSRLNAKALDFVRAPKQAEAMKNILPYLLRRRRLSSKGAEILVTARFPNRQR